MTAGVTVRAAVPEDVPVLTGLERALFGDDAWSEPLLRAELDGAGRHFVVAVGEGGPVGYAVTALVDGVADLRRIGVRDDRQRSGVARVLLADVLDRARADGAGRMLLEVGAGNTPACALYARSGFVEIARRRRYYRDGSDAVVMQCPLDGPRDDGGRMGG